MNGGHGNVVRGFLRVFDLVNITFLLGLSMTAVDPGQGSCGPRCGPPRPGELVRSSGVRLSSAPRRVGGWSARLMVRAAKPRRNRPAAQRVRQVRLVFAVLKTMLYDAEYEAHGSGFEVARPPWKVGVES